MGQAKSTATSTESDHDYEAEWIRSVREAGVGERNDRPDKRFYEFGNPSTKLKEHQLAALKTFIEECEQKGVNGLIAEFDRELKNWQPWTEKENDSISMRESVNAHYVNLEKNRYNNIFCLDATRVVLRGPNRAYDYINANVMQSEKNREDGDYAPFLNKYICAMAPIKDTIEDFWAMVVQEHVAYIFMLCDHFTHRGRYTRTDDLYKRWCEDYYPEAREQEKCFGDIIVKCKGLHQHGYGQIMKTTLSVKSKADNFKEIIVLHYRWMRWNEFGSVPITSSTPLYLLEMSRASHLTTLVHCSSGAGRTGTLIAAEYIIELIMQGKKIDLVEAVKYIRRQRAHLIETGMEYCYVVLILYGWYTAAARKAMLVPARITPEDTAYMKFCDAMHYLDIDMIQAELYGWK